MDRFETFLSWAKEYIATKERTKYYSFNSMDAFYQKASYLDTLTDENVAYIREQKEKYGADFDKHIDDILDKIFKEEEMGFLLSDLEKIIDIDIDHIYYKYKFKIYEIDADKKVHTLSHDVELSDDDYAKLLAWIIVDDFLTMNTLRHHDRNLYDTIMRGIDAHYYDDDCFFCENPYVAVFDEAQTDAEAIMKQHDIHRSGGHLMTPLY